MTALELVARLLSQLTVMRHLCKGHPLRIVFAANTLGRRRRHPTWVDLLPWLA